MPREYSVKPASAQTYQIRPLATFSNITRSVFKKIIVEGYRAVGSLSDSFQSSNFFIVVVVVVLY